MHYLTPELLDRYRSSDDEVAEAAAKEWEQAIAMYNEELEAILPLLPAGVCTLLDRWSLHDAKVLGIMVARRKPRLSLLVRLEGTSDHPGKMLELQYLLARTSKHPGFSIREYEAEKKDSQDAGRIQYDEFRKVADDPVGVFSHSLLLKGNYELEIRFTEMQVRQMQKVILPSVERMGLTMA